MSTNAAQDIESLDLPPLHTADEKNFAMPEQIGALHFNFTNRCNLRCSYCPQGSHPEEFHADATENFMDCIFGIIKKYKISTVGLGYYGELLLIDGWWRWAEEILNLGVTLTATSNFSRILTPDEVRIFSRFQKIQISIDTYDHAVLKKVRKALDVRTVIYNTQLIRAYCLANGVALPHMQWAGVLTDLVVPQLKYFVAMAAANGISDLYINEMTRFSGTPDGARNIADLNGEELLAAVAHIREARIFAPTVGVDLVVQGLPRIHESLFSELHGRAQSGEHIERSGIQAAYTFPADDIDKLPPGFTRNCKSPWFEAYLDPKGDVYPCCAYGEIMGRIKSESDFSSVLDNQKYRDLRRALFNGQHLNNNCTLCPVRGAIPVEQFQQEIEEMLSRVEQQDEHRLAVSGVALPLSPG